MTLPAQIAKHFREAHYGGNYTGSNLKDQLTGITWQQATTSIHSLNTIAMLVFHINYYVSAVLKVMQGGPLNASDKYSYDCPPITSQEDWDKLLNKFWSDADHFASFVEQMPESKLQEPFLDGKYGTWYRNITGVNEHTHYHLGQIAIIKKMVLQSN